MSRERIIVCQKHQDKKNIQLQTYCSTDILG